MAARWILRAGLAIALMAGPAAARAAGPTLGATVENVLYADEDLELTVINRSTVEAVFTFDAADGWSVSPASLILQPEEQAIVFVTGIGTDGSRLAVRVASSSDPPAGTQRGEIVLVSTLFTERPFDPWPWILAALLGLCALVCGTFAWRRRAPILAHAVED